MLFFNAELKAVRGLHKANSYAIYKLENSTWEIAFTNNLLTLDPITKGDFLKRKRLMLLRVNLRMFCSENREFSNIL